ncbi:galactose-3-O-sulfotransferase 2-like [Oscarella lobularis]|uniref:galactose-3-O-sulfotransferase 2-like n=1 Tax=Oscarella lobularis TaxID=121494 RepID=UPI0033139522
MRKAVFRVFCLALCFAGSVLLLRLTLWDKSPNKYAYPKSSSTRVTKTLAPATPVRNFVFVKTHKTGSTSIRDILRRYIRSHGLIELVSEMGPQPYMKNQFLEVDNPNTYRVTHKPGDYNALISHCRYRKSVIDELIPSPIYFTILRNPYSLFLSAFDFFPPVRQCAGGVGISSLEVLDNPRTYYERLQNCVHHWHILNPMAYDLGLEPPYDEKDVRNRIREMDDAFSFVMIMEHYPESVVMLRRLLKWNLTDVVMMPVRTHPKLKKDENVSNYEKLVAHHEDVQLTDRHKEVLRDWQRADFLIYNHFLDVFREKIRDEERRTGDFVAEVEEYKEDDQTLHGSQVQCRQIGVAKKTAFFCEKSLIRLNSSVT